MYNSNAAGQACHFAKEGERLRNILAELLEVGISGVQIGRGGAVADADDAQHFAVDVQRC